MRPGEASISLGMLTALQPDAVVGAVAVRVETPLSQAVGLTGTLGLFGSTDGRFSPRDAQFTLPIRLVSEPTVSWTVQPGVSLPLGSVSSGIEYTVLTTSSVDPTLGTTLAVGSTWMGLLDLAVRVPVHKGFDRIRQGAYASADARVARRVAGGAVLAGVAVASQRSNGLTSPGFHEVAAVAGVNLPLGDAWGSRVVARVPIAYDTQRYVFALQVGATRVVGKPRSR